MSVDLGWLGARLEIDGELVGAELHGSGHINDTYLATYAAGDAGALARRYIHQRINEEIFKDPAALMRNVTRVTQHIRRTLEERGADQIDRRVLTIVPTPAGESCVVDADGNTWRTYAYIENAATYDVVETPAQAYEVASAFAAFQGMLVDLPGPRLEVTVPDFHNTPLRLERLHAAVDADSCDRASGARPEIAAIERRSDIVDRLLSLHREGSLPERIAHNDTKINNVLIDDASGEGLCVIDLDTVMPGLALDDFGDLVRTSTCFAREDDRDLTKVVVELQIFEALARGYLSAAGAFLTAAEIENLVVSGKLMTIETGIRFLTDHLEGDTYFRVHRPDHNLDRCRVQLKLLESIEENQEAMEAIVAKAARELC